MCYKLLFLLFFGWAAAASADEYHIGQGVALGDFYLSGYANLVAESPQGGAASVSLDDLSLFVTGNVNRWLNPFTEVEYASMTLLQQGDTRRFEGRLILERLYNDTHITDSDTLRLGKMLSPVGDWNLVHAAPLVQTINRPLTTFMGFSEYANGVSWLHENIAGTGVDWQLYWQPDREWHERSSSLFHRHYSHVWGVHLNLPLNLLDKAGTSYQQGTLVETGESYRVYGANLRKTFGNLMMESEATTASWSGTTIRAHDHEAGIYALADYGFSPRWHGILEWEYFQNHQQLSASRSTLAGIAYKPESALVWKLEVVHQMGIATSIPSGLFASFSTLF